MTTISGCRSLRTLKGKEPKLRPASGGTNRKVMETLIKWRRETLYWVRAAGVFLKDETLSLWPPIVAAGG